LLNFVTSYKFLEHAVFKNKIAGPKTAGKIIYTGDLSYQVDFYFLEWNKFFSLKYNI